MIKPIKSLEAIRPGTVITDSLFDELRYGDTKPAAWVNEFGSAEALQKVCEEFVQKNGELDDRHAARRMYLTYERATDRQKRLARSKELVTAEDIAYADAVARTERKQQLSLIYSRKNARRYL